MLKETLNRINKSERGLFVHFKDKCWDKGNKLRNNRIKKVTKRSWPNFLLFNLASNLWFASMNKTRFMRESFAVLVNMKFYLPLQPHLMTSLETFCIEIKLSETTKKKTIYMNESSNLLFYIFLNRFLVWNCSRSHIFYLSCLRKNMVSNFHVYCSI